MYERRRSHPGRGLKMREVSARSGWILVKMMPWPVQYTTGRTIGGRSGPWLMISSLYKSGLGKVLYLNPSYGTDFNRNHKHHNHSWLT